AFFEKKALGRIQDALHRLLRVFVAGHGRGLLSNIHAVCICCQYTRTPSACQGASAGAAFWAWQFWPKFHMASRMGLRLFPRSVKLYSTRGGTSAYTCRWTRPLASISRSWAVSTF